MSAVRSTDRLDMTLIVLTGCRTPTPIPVLYISAYLFRIIFERDITSKNVAAGDLRQLFRYLDEEVLIL